MITGDLTYRRLKFQRTADGYEARFQNVSQTLLIPGLRQPNPNDLFRNGQPGGWADPYDLTRMWVDDAGTTPMTLANLGTGVGRCITKGNAITLTQANAADRPVWGRHPVSGIRNLLSFTRQFDNAYWVKANSTVVADVEADPIDGQVTVDRMTTSAANGEVRPSFSYPSTGIYTLTVYAKTETLPQLILRLDRNTNTANVTFTFATEAVTATGANIISGSATNLGNGWYRLRATANVVNAGFVVGYTAGAATGSVLLSRPQIESGSVATSPQDVTNRFDITEVGSPSLYYFSGNGVNQRWSSNATVNFSGVDKVTVWAGARKLSDAADAALAGLSTIASDGAWELKLPHSATANASFLSKRTTTQQAVVSGIAAPITLSLVGESDIASPFVRLTAQGTTTTVTASQGTGNYSNATLHVFSRGGSSLFYNGFLYSLIIAGGLYDSRTIARFADWTTKPRRLITA